MPGGKQLKMALQLMDSVVKQGFQNSIHMYGCLLQECIKMQSLDSGKQVHDHIIKNGFESQIFLENTLIEMYGKCGSVCNAQVVFDRMVKRNIFSWTAIISAYVKQGKAEIAVRMFEQMKQSGVVPDKVLLIIMLKAHSSMAALEGCKKIHEYINKKGFKLDAFIGSALIDMYVKCCSIQDARRVFNEMDKRNVVVWNAMIGGYAEGNGQEALALFQNMKYEGVDPDNVTYISVLKACSNLTTLEIGKNVHAEIIGSGLSSDVSVGNALVGMYVKCGNLDCAYRAFNDMCKRDVISWTVLITGYVQKGHANQALTLFQQMQREGVKPDNVIFVSILKACGSLSHLEYGKWVHALMLKSGLNLDNFVESALVDMYAKCGSIEDAHQVFNTMHRRDLVSWTSMIRGFVQKRHCNEAFFLFERMQQEGVRPDQVTFVSILQACTIMVAIERGMKIHAHVIRSGFETDVFVGSALVDMYAKCGRMQNACQIFNKIRSQGVVSWNAMIAGYAQQGLGKKALWIFEEMHNEDIKPDDVTFISVLSACSHSGLVDEGCQYFDSMSKDYSITASTPHYLCMIDLFSRAGCFNEAHDFIIKMPTQADEAIWITLLGSYRKHGNVEIARHAFECVNISGSKHFRAYTLLSNIYAAAGGWDQVAKIKKAMDDAGVEREAGGTWIEVHGKIYDFCIEDKNYPYSKEIQAELESMTEVVKHTHLNFILQDMECENKRNGLCDHSGKLAIVFGLIVTPPGTPLHIKKKLEICRDCHNDFEFLSEIAWREIAVNDANCLHLFKHGLSSCRDCW